MATTLRSFINDLNQVVQQSKVQQAMSLASGSIGTMEQYHRKCGRLEGMDEVIKVAREMLGQMEAAIEDGELPELPPVGKQAGGKKK